MSTEKEQLTGIITLMGSAARGAYSLAGLEQYKKDNAGALPASYNEVHVMERGSTGPRRTHLPAHSQQWRVLIRSVAQKYENAQEMRARARLLHEATLTVGSETYYLERSTTDDPIAPDSGWFSGTTELTH